MKPIPVADLSELMIRRLFSSHSLTESDDAVQFLLFLRDLDRVIISLCKNRPGTTADTSEFDMYGVKFTSHNDFVIKSSIGLPTVVVMMSFDAIKTSPEGV